MVNQSFGLIRRMDNRGDKIMVVDRVSKELIEEWLGTDNKLEEAIEVIQTLANGQYTIDGLNQDIIEYAVLKKEWDKKLKHGHKKYVKNTGLDINYKPLQKIKILLENNSFHKIKIKNYKPLIHSMNDGSGINWHNDAIYSYGITFYINRRWNLKFGGEFLFTSENANGFIPLVGNSLVIVKSPFKHKVNPVLSPVMPRISVQIFMK